MKVKGALAIFVLLGLLTMPVLADCVDVWTNSQCGSIELSWSETDADYYNVYRGTEPGGPYELIEPIIGNFYLDENVVWETPYYYVVSPVDGSGNEMCASEETEGFALDCGCVDVWTTSQCGSIQLDWSGIYADHYNVYRSTASGGPYDLIGDTTDQYYLDMDVVLGTPYYYVVKPTDGFGNEICESDEAEGSADDCGCVDVWTTSQCGTVLLEWFGNYADHYNVYRATDPEGPYDFIGSAGEQSYLDIAVVVGTPYYYVVKPANMDDSELCESNVAEGVALDCGCVNDLAATPGCGTIDLSWTGIGADHYNVYRSTTMGGPYNYIGETVDQNYLDTAVVVGTPYYYVVKPANADGYEFCVSNEAGGIPEDCNCIDDLTATSACGNVQLSWTGTGADHYNVYRSTTMGGPFTYLGKSELPNYLDAAVLVGKMYYYVVRPVDASGELCQSNEASGTPESCVPNPDGTKIVFASSRDGGQSEIYIMNDDGSDQTRLTYNDNSDNQPCLSHDGNKIIYQSIHYGYPHPDTYDVYIMNADGTGATKLTNSANYVSSPSFSPDGMKIAFDSYRDGDYEIFVMNADGTGESQLTNNAFYDHGPSFSPDGTEIIFGSSRDGNNEFYTMNIDGTGEARLTENSFNDYVPVSWSPDGTRITYTSFRNSHYDIYTMDIEEKTETRLTFSGEGNWNPSFSPDGTKIVYEFSGNIPGEYIFYHEIFIMNAEDGSGNTRLTNNAVADNDPSFAVNAYAYTPPQPVPEFPTMVLPLGLIAGMVALVFVVRKEL